MLYSHRCFSDSQHWLALRFSVVFYLVVCGCIPPPSPLVIFFSSWGVGVVWYVGSHVQSFSRQVVTSWVAGQWRISSGTCPPLAADVVKRS